MAEYHRRYTRHPTPIETTPAPDSPPEDHPVWTRLVKGELPYEFNYSAAGMLIFNFNLQWQRDPSRLPLLIKQTRSFFQKYHHLLSGDVAKLFS